MAAMCSFLLTYILIVASLSFVDAHNVSLDFKLNYITKSPLGVPQQVIAINGLFPGPVLNATTNYDVYVNVHNRLDEAVLLSWSGVQMRSNSWQDGVLGTNCPIPIGWNWTYKFQLKDQIGSFFYFPSLKLQRASGGFGSIIVNNRDPVQLPFPTPDGDIVIFINDWYIQSHVGLRTILDDGKELGIPDGVLINGKGPYRYNMTTVPGGIDYESIDARPGKTYRLHVHNVGVSTSLNFRIQNHTMVLVETEGSYTMQQNYISFDIHVGQSYSFLVTMNQNPTQDYYIVASARFVNESTWEKVIGVAVLHYIGAIKNPTGPLPNAPDDVYDKTFSMNQARSIRSNVSASGARTNAQGSFRYGSINITETFVLVNEEPVIFNGKCVTTINRNSFKQPQTPFTLADEYNLTGIYNLNLGSNPFRRERSSESSLINGTYKGFMEIILQNNNTKVQSYHLDGYSFFLAGMDYGVWTENSRGTYNKWDGVSRSTTQVYPGAWTAVLVSLDNAGIWNLRIENLDNWYRGQETYLKIYNPEVSTGLNRPENMLFCGALSKYQKTQSLESTARRDPPLNLVLLLLVLLHLFSILQH